LPEKSERLRISHGSQREIKETRSQEEHIKNPPVRQMEYLMSDKRFGSIHGHAHVRVAPVDRLSSIPHEPQRERQDGQ
jgi:hypothetical protein